MKSLNKTLAAVALSLVAAGSAFAGDAADDLSNRTAFAGSLTRAEVQADYAAAAKNGPLVTEAFVFAGNTVLQGPSRDRAEVRAEAVQTTRTHVVHELMM